MADGDGCFFALLGVVALGLMVLAYIDGLDDGRCNQACWSMGEEANTAGSGCWCSESGKVPLPPRPPKPATDPEHP